MFDQLALLVLHGFWHGIANVTVSFLESYVSVIVIVGFVLPTEVSLLRPLTSDSQVFMVTQHPGL